LGVKILNQLNQSSCFSTDGSLIDDFKEYLPEFE